jgi:hypothetical protein
MEGLLFLNSISDVPGFVGRGVSTDGKSHYAMGSNDQTLAWFLGLWRYLDSGLASGDERQRIVAHLPGARLACPTRRERRAAAACGRERVVNDPAKT